MKLRLLLLSICILLVNAAFAGGGSFEGGGGLGEDESVSFGEFELTTRQLVAELPQVLRQVELAPELPEGLRAKLFRGNFTIYQALASAMLHFPIKKACLDPDGNEVPASALVKGDERVLCFSHALLSTRIERAKLLRRMTAIAAHEASHLIEGVDEAEARLLEKLVQLKRSLFP